MSHATEQAQTGADTACAQCGAAMTEDQEWCLECGTARTLIHTAPDWRIAVAITGLFLAIVVAGIVVALNALSGSSDRTAATQISGPAASAPATNQGTPGTTAASPTTAGTTAIAAPPTPPGSATTTPVRSRPARRAFASWPIGLGGWTVILTVRTTRAAARADARHLAPTVAGVGVLYSSDHRSLTPGLWVVFSGRYPTGAAAQAAATKLQAAGHPLAHPRMVAPPGG